MSTEQDGVPTGEARVRRLGVLTGGGDCPGLNAVLRAVSMRCGQQGVELIGYRNGWAGVLAGSSVQLDRPAVKGILHLGGTMLGTSRTDPMAEEDGPARVMARLAEDGVEGLVVVGGDGTLSATLELARRGLRVVGVPKTIDNDLRSTDVTFGHDTAVHIATEAIDRLHSTAEAHNRVMVVEVMGRHTGWIAAHAGIAGGADVILVPEVPWEIEQVCDRIRSRQQRGRPFAIVVVAEGVQFASANGNGNGKVNGNGNGTAPDRRSSVKAGATSMRLAEEIEQRVDTEVRTVVLGHTQRGGSPTPYDRVLATRFGVRAADMAMAGEWGRMVALRGTEVVTVELEEAVCGLKTLDAPMLDLIRALG